MIGRRNRRPRVTGFRANIVTKPGWTARDHNHNVRSSSRDVGTDSLLQSPIRASGDQQHELTAHMAGLAQRLGGADLLERKRLRDRQRKSSRLDERTDVP